MKPPENVQLFEGEIATYWMDADGILYSLSKSPRRTVKNLTDNIALVKRITGGKRVPLLIYLSNSPVPDKQTRKFAAEQMAANYTAMAMVSTPGLAQLIMNVLFKFKPPSIPMKSFSDGNEARDWLKQFCNR